MKSLELLLEKKLKLCNLNNQITFTNFFKFFLFILI